MAAADNAKPRLLLCEFISEPRSRTENAKFYGYYAGVAQAAGLPCLWLCVGAELAIVAAADGDCRPVAKLADADLSAFLQAARDFAPTHAIFNELRPDAFDADLRAAVPDLQLLAAPQYFLTPDSLLLRVDPTISLDPALPPPFGQVQRAYDLSFRVGWLLDWLGVPQIPGVNPEDWLVGAIAPSYPATLLGDGLARVQPLLKVLGGRPCGYHQAIARNPLYEGVDLTDVRRSHGCSFCNWSMPDVSAPQASALDLAREQLQAAELPSRSPRSVGHYDLYDSRILAHIDAFAELVIELGLPPSMFYVHPRIDEVIGARKKLDRALQRFAATGHRLFLHRVGVENLSPAENARFNKAIDLERVETFLEQIDGYHRDLPETFFCHTTLGYILYTPWTTLDDLQISLDACDALAFQGSNEWLCSTLEMDEGAAITRLAEKQGGLLVDAYEDPAFLYMTSSEFNFRRWLRPWRFADARVALFFRMIVRLVALELRRPSGDAVFAQDELFAWSARLLEANDLLGVSRVRLARALCSALRRQEAPQEPKALLIQVLTQVAGRPLRAV